MAPYFSKVFIGDGPMPNAFPSIFLNSFQFTAYKKIASPLFQGRAKWHEETARPSGHRVFRICFESRRVDVDERRALRTIGSLRRSLIDFAKGAKKYAAERRMNISEAIRNDEFPTYTEVSMVVEELAEELLCCYF